MKENILGKRMKVLRDKKDLKQNEVAKGLGVSPYQLSRYENGKSKPDPDLIWKIATYYGVRTDYLFGMTDNPNEESEDFKEYINDPLTSIAFKDFESLTDEQKQEAIEMIKFIKFKESQKEQ